MINLTNLFKTTMTEDDVKAINQAAKPGYGYELCIGASGRIVWEHFNSEDGGPGKVEVSFHPILNMIRVQVPAYIKIEVIKKTIV